MSTERLRLSDAQTVAIASAACDEAPAVVARRLDLPRQRVAAMLRRIRSPEAWSLPLTWTACAVCGERFAHGPKRTVHLACEKQRHAAAERPRNRARRTKNAPKPTA